MKVCLTIILLFLCCSQLLATPKTEAYTSIYRYNIQLTNREGAPLSDIPISFKIDSEIKTFYTDSNGIISFNISSGSECPSNKNFFERMFIRFVWTPKRIKLLVDGKPFIILKKWKKIFSESNEVTTILLYENGTMWRGNEKNYPEQNL